MTHYKALIETEYLGQWDLPQARDVVVTIASVERWAPEVKRKKKWPDGRTTDEPNKRIKLSFVGKKKAWLAGPVSQKTIASLYGPHFEQWMGKTISLYVDHKIVFGGTTTGGIRVRLTKPTSKPTTDALDNPVDQAKAAQLDRAREETLGTNPIRTNPDPDEDGR